VTVTLVDCVAFGAAICLAVTVQVSVTAGAVYNPEALIVPHVALHVTDVLAENCTVPPWLTLGFVGEIVNPATTPAPERLTACGLLVAESVNVSVALRVPDAEGLKTTLTVHVATGERLVPQVFAEIGKSAAFAPPTAMLLIEAVVLPPLYSDTVCAALLEPTPTLP